MRTVNKIAICYMLSRYCWTVIRAKYVIIFIIIIQVYDNVELLWNSAIALREHWPNLFSINIYVDIEINAKKHLLFNHV